MNRKMLLFSSLLALSTATGYCLDHGMPLERMNVLRFLGYLLAIAVMTAGFRLLLALFGKIVTIVSEKRAPADSEASSGGRSPVSAAGKPSDLAPVPKPSLPLCTALFFLFEIPAFLAFYPGIFAYDVYQVNQVVGGSYDTHHPLLHTLIFGACYQLGARIGNVNRGITLYCLVQMAVMALVFACLYRFAAPRIPSRLGRIFFFLIYAIFPVHSVLLLSTTKDVLFAGMCALAVTMTAETFEQNQTRPWKGRELARVSAPYVLAALLRKNAIYALLLLLVFGCLPHRKHRENRDFAWREYRKVLVISAAGALLLSGALKLALRAESGSIHEMLSVPANQMGRIYYGDGSESSAADLAGGGPASEGASDSSDIHVIERYVDPSVSWYLPHIADPMKEHLKNADTLPEVLRFLGDSIRLFGKHPLVSLDSFLYLTEGYWYLFDTTCANLYGGRIPELNGYLQTGGAAPAYQVTRASKLPSLERFYTWLLKENGYQRIPLLRLLFSPALYFWAYVLGMMLAGRTAQNEHRFRCSFWLLAGIWATNLLGPAVCVRYTYFLFLCVPVMWVYARPCPPWRPPG